MLHRFLAVLNLNAVVIRDVRFCTLSWKTDSKGDIVSNLSQESLRKWPLSVSFQGVDRCQIYLPITM